MKPLALCIIAVLFALPGIAIADIYMYRDADGRLNFVDNTSRIPAEFRDQHKKMADAPEPMGIKNPGSSSPPARNDQPEHVTGFESDSKDNRLKTAVLIENNQILVPVKVAMGNRSVKLSLLLDTGATNTVLHRGALERLEIPSGHLYKARVAGGGTVLSEKVRFRYIEVGPFREEPSSAMVIDWTGPRLPYDGLLGMDFLRRHPYAIDYEKGLITWETSR